MFFRTTLIWFYFKVVVIIKPLFVIEDYYECDLLDFQNSSVKSGWLNLYWPLLNRLEQKSDIYIVYDESRHDIRALSKNNKHLNILCTYMLSLFPRRNFYLTRAYTMLIIKYRIRNYCISIFWAIMYQLKIYVYS